MMRHDIDRLRQCIEEFHANVPDTGNQDFDDFTLVHCFVIPGSPGPVQLEVNRGDGEYEIELVAAHSYTPARKVLLEWAHVLLSDDLWPNEDAKLDLATVKLARELPAPLRNKGRIVPPCPSSPTRGRPLCMSLSFRSLDPIDMVLVFDRFPLSRLSVVR